MDKQRNEGIMNDSHFDAIARTLSDELGSRRGLLAGLAGLAGLTALGLDDLQAEAKKRKNKKRKNKKGNKGKKRKKKGKGGNNGGDDGGGGDDCNQTLCEGQCVDLQTDPNNCGACGAFCGDDVLCVGGRCAIAVGSQGDGDGQFNAPFGVTLSGNSTFLVADANNQRVVLVSGSSQFRGAFGEPGNEDGQFLRPVGITVSSVNDDVIVTDVDRGRIQRFRIDGVFQVGFGSTGGGIEQVRNPRALAIDPVNAGVEQIFVADTGNNRIKRLSSNLFPLEDIGGPGSGEGEFNGPEGIAVDGDRNLVVADTGNNRIQITDRDGGFIRAFGRQGNGNGEFDRPVSVALAENGNIFVVDQGNNRVQEFTSNGQFVGAFGRGGSAVGEFDEPFGIVTADGTIAVTDTGNNRIQFFFQPTSPNA